MLVLQQSAGQHMEKPGNCVQAGDTVRVVCWKRAGPGWLADSGDLLRWPEDTKERNSNYTLWGGFLFTEKNMQKLIISHTGYIYI